MSKTAFVVCHGTIDYNSPIDEPITGGIIFITTDKSKVDLHVSNHDKAINICKEIESIKKNFPLKYSVKKPRRPLDKNSKESLNVWHQYEIENNKFLESEKMQKSKVMEFAESFMTKENDYVMGLVMKYASGSGNIPLPLIVEEHLFID